MFEMETLNSIRKTITHVVPPPGVHAVLREFKNSNFKYYRCVINKQSSAMGNMNAKYYKLSLCTLEYDMNVLQAYKHNIVVCLFVALDPFCFS